MLSNESTTPPAPEDGRRFLVDRLWPRGVKKDELRLDGWLREVAPSEGLRRWFGHEPARWKEFQQRYAAELEAKPDAWQLLLAAARQGDVSLLYSAREEVLLVDRNNYHTFLPLLYQVAAAELEPEAIAYPVRTILREIANARFLLAEVEGVDLTARQLRTNMGPVSYDYLVLALGSAPHFFGVPGAREHAFTLKSMEDAIRLRNHVLGRFEAASWERDPDVCERALTFVVVGGGPTGVEFAGALAELINGPLRRDYPDLDFRKARVMLLEAQQALLPGLPERLQRYACRRLQQMGVEVRLKATVERIEPGAVHVRGPCFQPFLHRPCGLGALAGGSSFQSDRLLQPLAGDAELGVGLLLL